MSPHRKLQLANALMVVGVLPLLFALGAVLMVLYGPRHAYNEAGAFDAFLLMFLVLAGYAIACVLSGGGALWSGLLAKRHPDLRAPGSTVLRVLVCLALLGPLLWQLAASMRWL